jgi:hypothetical protein
MLRVGRTREASALCLSALLLALGCPALAHDKKQVGKITLTIGWGEEPVFSGARNSVEVDVADHAGAPITDLGGTLSVEVAFGDQRVTLPLVPAGQKGRFHAWILPTRPGQYSFRVMGSVKGQAVDIASACSDTTFECVADGAAIQFPVKDPSPGELADRLGRELPRAERALAAATAARQTGFAAIAAAAIALVAAIGIGVRTKSKGS